MRVEIPETEAAHHSAAAWVTLTFVTFWAALLGHEGAHFGMAHFVYSAEYATGAVSPRAELSTVIAGPVFTIVMVVLAVVVAVRWRFAQSVAIAAIAFGVSLFLYIAKYAPQSRRSLYCIAVGIVAGWLSALTLGRAIGLRI